MQLLQYLESARDSTYDGNVPLLSQSRRRGVPVTNIVIASAPTTKTKFICHVENYCSQFENYAG